jgi:hypothetical protein
MFAIITLLLGAVVFHSAPAFAAGPVDNAISALKNGTVYIEPGTEFTGRDTVVTLKQNLKSNDHIALVMLPASSLEGTTIDEIAAKIDNATGKQYIIGLSVGNETLGYSSYLPTGVSNDAMVRAASISNNPVDALRTYPKVMHEWQAAHPEQAYPEKETQNTTSTQVPKTPQDSSSVPYGIGGGGLLIAVAVAAAVIFRRKSKRAIDDAIKVKFSNDTPQSLRDAFSRVVALSEKIQNRHILDRLERAAFDMNQFFQRTHGTKESYDAQIDEQNMLRSTEWVVKVLESYVDIQDFPQYYDNVDELVGDGMKTIDSYADSVRNAVKKSTTDKVFDFKQGQKIIQSERR